MEKRVNISEREHFKIMCQVFEETLAEHKNEAAKEALITFSNKAHKRIFAPKAERLRVTARVEQITTEVLAVK